MKYGVKISAEICAIKDKRKEHEEIKEKLFQMERKMADMTLNREVGLCAFKMDRYLYLRSLLDTLAYDKQVKVNKELADLEEYFIISRKNYNIVRYRALRSEYNTLKNKLGDYHKAINIDFRNELRNVNSPDIYIYQIENANSMLRHIILPEKTIDVVPDMKYVGNIVVFPFYEIYSNREFRHFYNKTSFKYLEALSKDYDYRLENKNIGKVKIKKM